MATLKDILGEAYREDMTLADIESALADKKLADLSSGEYVSKGKLMDYETRAKKAEKALAEKLTEEEKAQIELAKREEYYKALEKENARNKYITKLGKTIKDEKVLNEIADLYADGDYASAIDKQNEYLAKYHGELEKTIKLIDIAGRIDTELKGNEAQDIIKVINNYSNALNLLDDYDYKRISKHKGTIDNKKITYENCIKLLIN